MDFVTVRCQCGGVVLDAVRFRGLVRSKCSKCRKRVWVQGRGDVAEVIRVDKRPSRQVSQASGV